MKTAILYHKLACRQLSPERAVIGFWCVFFSSNDHCNPYRALYSEFCGHPHYIRYFRRAKNHASKIAWTKREAGAIYDLSAVPAGIKSQKDRLPVYELSAVNGRSLRFKCRATHVVIALVGEPLHLG
jgi:hypothetical protein